MSKNRRITGGDSSFVESGKATRFSPGQSGNPNGRPRTAKFSEACRRLAEEVGSAGLTKAEELAAYCYCRALKGSIRHAELFLNYCEGKPKQAHDEPRRNRRPHYTIAPEKGIGNEIMPDLSNEEARELVELLEESALSNWERRRRRMIAAEERLAKVSPDFIVQALKKARWGGPLSEDEFLVTHLGFTRRECASGEPEREIQRREARKAIE